MRQTITTLAPAWVAAQRATDVVGAKIAPAELAAIQLYPDQPAETLFRDSATGRLWAADRVSLERNFPRALPAYDHWLAQCNAIDSAFDVPDIERAFNDAAVVADGIAARIAAMRPVDPAEAAVKFRVLLKLYGDGQGGLDQAEQVDNSILLPPD